MSTVIGALVGVFSAGCDQGEQHDTRPPGPYVHAIGMNVGPDKALAANGAIEIAFDRFLLPATVIRQSFVVRTARGDVAGNPVVGYDPVARVVTLGNPNLNGDPWLVPGQSYTLTMPIPSVDGDTNGGLRAVDGATLDPNAPATERNIGFFATEPPTAAAVTAPTMQFCSDVLPIFAQHCSGSSCHGAPAKNQLPASGLSLVSSEMVSLTAIRRVSIESNTGARAGVAVPPSREFALNMPIIDPGTSGTSWLMYKLLLARPAESSEPAVCNSTTPPAVAFEASTAPYTKDVGDGERMLLGNQMLGREMPYPDDPGGANTATLTFDELERIRLWIDQGASVQPCTCD